MDRTFTTVALEEVRHGNVLSDSADPAPFVLIVDDHPLIADTLVQILHDAGYAAISTYDAESAHELAEIAPPELLLTDICLPGMDGVDLALLIQSDIPDCKILLFSALVGTVDLLQGAREKGRDFTLLAKPIHPRDLLERVAYSLRTPLS